MWNRVILQSLGRENCYKINDIKMTTIKEMCILEGLLLNTSSFNIVPEVSKVGYKSGEMAQCQLFTLAWTYFFIRFMKKLNLLLLFKNTILVH